MTTAPNKSSSGTPQGTGNGKSVSFEEALKIAMANNTGSASEGPTRADAQAIVQNVYQSLLGRSAVGTELNQAINRYMANEGGVGGQGNVEQFVMETNEYQAKSENKYLDAIYNKRAQDLRGAQA